MGATLWHGTITAHRYRFACPRCGSDLASADCDEYGQTLVLCRCTPAPFLMIPQTEGKGAPWPIDLSGMPEPEPLVPRLLCENG